MVSFIRKMHHHAVDLYYDTYFSRGAGLEGKPRRGAPPIPDRYLDEILRMTRKGMNLEKIADKLGQLGPKGKDRVRKQRALAVKRYTEIVESIRRLGAAQQARDATKPAITPVPPSLPVDSAPTSSATPKRSEKRKK
jgi:hypothetical protein